MEMPRPALPQREPRGAPFHFMASNMMELSSLAIDANLPSTSSQRPRSLATSGSPHPLQDLLSKIRAQQENLIQSGPMPNPALGANQIKREASRAWQHRLSTHNRTLSVPIMLSETDETGISLPFKLRTLSLYDMRVGVSKMTFQGPCDSAESETLPLVEPVVELTQTPCDTAEHQWAGPFVILQPRRDSVPSGPILEVTQIRVGTYIEEAVPSSSNSGRLQDADKDGVSGRYYKDSPCIQHAESELSSPVSPLPAVRKTVAHWTESESAVNDEMYIRCPGLPDIPYPIPDPPRSDPNLMFKREMYGSASQLPARAQPTPTKCMRAICCCCCCKVASPPSYVDQGNQTEMNRFYVTHNTMEVGSFGPNTPHTMPRRARRDFVRPGLVTRNSRQPGYRSKSYDCL